MRSKLLAALAGLVLACVALPVLAATINLNDPGYISNASFESGVLSPWVSVQNGGGVYAPNATNYTAGSDGLSSGIVPNGSYVAFTPSTGGAGAGVIQQELSTQFVSGNVYNLSVWVAMPLLVQTPNCTGAAPNQCANHTTNSTFTIALAYATGPGGVGGGQAQGGLTQNISQNAVTISQLGVWALYTIQVTSAISNADIIVILRSDTTSITQPHQVDFDIAPTATPLPAAVWMFGSVVGLGGLVGLRRRKKQLA